ncbi:MAG: DUF86 domain-containing protein, partial [Candidatus Aminicenantes bacterium]
YYFGFVSCFEFRASEFRFIRVRVLHEENILEKELFETMDKMAKFRNIVVHNYDKVDTSIVVIILTKHLDDFLTYKNAIIKILKEADET